MSPNRKTTCRVVCGREKGASSSRSRLGNCRSYTGGRLGFIAAGIIRRALQTHLTGALIQALSGSSAACKLVIEDFNELASPRLARRSRDRKWLISIHFGNYRLNARADIIIRGLILGGDSLLRQKSLTWFTPSKTRSPRGHPPRLPVSVPV